MTEVNRFTGEAEHLQIQPNARIGVEYRADAAPTEFLGTAIVRSGSVVYGDVVLGDSFQSGHNVLIRENTTIGRHVTVGTNSVIDGQCHIADFVKLETGVYVSTHVSIGSRVFVGPNAVLTNDRYPLRQRDTYEPEGVVLEDDVTLGANVTVCPGVRIGAGSFVAAGAVVTKSVPPQMLVLGHAGQMRPLPVELAEGNVALSWLDVDDFERPG